MAKEFEDFKFSPLAPLEPIPEYTPPVQTYGDPGGFSLEEPVQMSHLEDSVRIYRPFQPYELNNDSGWKVHIAEGCVLDSHVLNGGGSASSAIQVRVPTIGGIPIVSTGGGWVRPKITIPNNTSWVYLRFQTDEHGNIDAETSSGDPDVWIEAFTSEQLSTHHEPPDGAGNNGVSGDYFYQIFRTEPETIGGTPRPKIITEGLQSNLPWQMSFKVQNISGVGARIYQDYDDDTNEQRLRLLTGGYAIDVDEQTDLIDISWEGDSLCDSGGTYSTPVYLPPGHPQKVDANIAEFQCIAERSGAGVAQVRVQQSFGGEILITGNGVDGSLTIEDCDGNELTLLEWEDGLIKTVGDSTIEVTPCSSTSS